MQKFEQVATKLSEIGIGQTGIVFGERSVVVDNLPWMSVYEWPIENIKPGEIASFGTLTYPFDNYTWAFVVGAIVGEFIILIIMQLVWSGVVEESTPTDFVYQGEDHNTCDIIITNALRIIYHRWLTIHLYLDRAKFVSGLAHKKWFQDQKNRSPQMDAPGQFLDNGLHVHSSISVGGHQI